LRSNSKLSVSIPVRVLGFLELYRSSFLLLRVCFNPCKGFGGFGTGKQKGTKYSHWSVSIPVRVLGVLEPSKLSSSPALRFVSIPVRVLGVLER